MKLQNQKPSGLEGPSALAVQRTDAGEGRFLVLVIQPDGSKQRLETTVPDTHRVQSSVPSTMPRPRGLLQLLSDLLVFLERCKASGLLSPLGMNHILRQHLQEAGDAGSLWVQGPAVMGVEVHARSGRARAVPSRFQKNIASCLPSWVSSIGLKHVYSSISCNSHYEYGKGKKVSGRS